MDMIAVSRNTRRDICMRTHLSSRLVGVGPRPSRSRTCLDTATPDFAFVIDRHPDVSRITIVSPCSGHGFKHSAAIGEAVCERLLDGRSKIDLTPFSLGRFAT